MTVGGEEEEGVGIAHGVGERKIFVSNAAIFLFFSFMQRKIELSPLYHAKRSMDDHLIYTKVC